MTTDGPYHRSAFHTAGGVDGTKEARPLKMALMIDVQQASIAYMDERDAQRYLDALADKLATLRENGIPVTWVTIGHENRLHSPEQNAAGAVCNTSELKEMDFYKTVPGMEDKNAHVFKDFIERHGPKTNEFVLQKDTFSAFNDSGLLAKHLHGVREIVVAGTVSTVCCLQTAIDAVQNGIQTTLATDAVAGWIGEGETRRLVYQEEGVSAEDCHRWHESQMRGTNSGPDGDFSKEAIEAKGQIGYSPIDRFIEGQTPSVIKGVAVSARPKTASRDYWN